MAEGSRSVGREIFVGVAIVVIAALVTAAIGLGGGSDGTGDVRTDPNGGSQTVVETETPQRAVPTICETNFGSCPIQWGTGEVGDPCTCTDVYGYTYSGSAR